MVITVNKIKVARYLHNSGVPLRTVIELLDMPSSSTYRLFKQRGWLKKDSRKARPYSKISKREKIYAKALIEAGLDLETVYHLSGVHPKNILKILLECNPSTP